MRRLIPAAVLLLAAVVLTVNSCGPKLVPERERPRPVYLSATPEELIASLQQRNEAIRGLQARGNLDYRFTYSSEPLKGSGIRMQFLKPDKVYIRGLTGLTGTLFLLVTNGETYWAENTKKRKVYTGQVTESVRTDGDAEIWEGLHPAVVAEALFLDDLEESATVCETYPDHYIITLLAEDGGGKLAPRRKMWFDRANLRVVRHRIFTESGQLRTDVLLANYKKVGNIELPLNYYINRPWEELRLELTLKDIRVNPEFNEDLFYYRVPNGFEVEDRKQREAGDAQPS